MMTSWCRNALYCLTGSLAIGAAVAAQAAPSKNRLFTEESRLSFDSVSAVTKGSAGPSQLYNGGRGYSIPGKPVGDTILALSAAGREPIVPNLALYDRHPLSMGGESKLFCQNAPGPFMQPAYSVFRPLEISPLRNLGSSRIDTVLGVHEQTTARLKLTRSGSSLASGFASELNDHLLLEISDDTLWAWPAATGYSDDTGQRLRLTRVRTSARDSNVLHAHRLRIDMNEQTRRCTLEFGPADSLSFDSVSTTLPDKYCESDHQNRLVVALEVRADAPVTSGTQIGSACLSSMSVTSIPAR